MSNPSKSTSLVGGHSLDRSWWCNHPHIFLWWRTHLLQYWILPAVYPHDVLGSLHLVCQNRDYDPVWMPQRKLELYKKKNGKIYGLVPIFLKEHSPLDLVPHFFWIVWKYLQYLSQNIHEPNMIHLLDHNLVIWIFTQGEARYLNHSKSSVQGTDLFISY